MKIHVAMLPQHLEDADCEQSSLALVVDTLRFTTTACRALEEGAKSVSVAGTIPEARSLATSSEHLLCGERHCKPIDGFDLGNSPFDYKHSVVKDKRLIFTTSNGTNAVLASQFAAEIWLAALTNRKAICEEIVRTAPNQVCIVCSGTLGVIALEDVLAAGAIAAELDGELSNDSAELAVAAWKGMTAFADERGLAESILSALQSAVGGRNVLAAGYDRDLEFAARIDSCPVIPKNSKAASKTFSLANPGK